MGAVLPFSPLCGNCRRTREGVHLYQHVLAGRPLERYWLCARCHYLASEWTDLRPMATWQERAAAGDMSAARITGGVAL